MCGRFSTPRSGCHRGSVQTQMPSMGTRGTPRLHAMYATRHTWTYVNLSGFYATYQQKHCHRWVYIVCARPPYIALWQHHRFEILWACSPCLSLPHQPFCSSDFHQGTNTHPGHRLTLSCPYFTLNPSAKSHWCLFHSLPFTCCHLNSGLLISLRDLDLRASLFLRRPAHVLLPCPRTFNGSHCDCIDFQTRFCGDALRSA